MKKLVFPVVMFVLLLAAGCKPSVSELQKQIADKEKELFAQNGAMPAKDKTVVLMELYQQFVDAYPTDSLAPVYIYKMAELSMNSGKNEDALKYFDQIIGDYGDFAKVPECYFLKGFVYENNIKDIKQARIAYTEFITKFPNHDLRDDAEISMKNLGKTPEQIVREFEENLKRKSDSIAAAQKK